MKLKFAGGRASERKDKEHNVSCRGIGRSLSAPSLLLFLHSNTFTSLRDH